MVYQAKNKHKKIILISEKYFKASSVTLDKEFYFIIIQVSAH